MSTIGKMQVGQAEAELEEKNSTDYDSAWKDVIEELFEPFMEFFFPQAHRDIDFSKGIEILDSELRDIKPYGNVGKRYADELIKVHLKDGSTACICVFIHIEVQGAKEKQGVFPERTYVYNYRAYDRNFEKGAKVISVAILTDEDRSYRPDEYLISQWGFELRMKIPIVKIIDYKYKQELMDKLESTDNPMAMVVNAQLRSYELKKAGNKKKSTAKWELIRQCYERGYSKRRIDALLKFIDWLIRLPDDLDKQLTKKVSQLEEEYKMPYVTSWERRAKKEGEERGVKIGEERGVKIGEERGAQIKAKETAKRMLEDDFPIESISKYTGLTQEEIKALLH